jgi:2-polyprenyl-3-methyl-5-hydroxy-6-metoxy-1,4-benzoquinol methylase
VTAHNHITNTIPICPFCEGNLEIFRKEASVWRCPVCRVGFRRPLPTVEELARIYDFDYYNSWGETADGYWSLKKALYRALIAAAPNSATRGSALDIGCATGAGLSALQDAGWIPTGIDINHHAVQIATDSLPGVKILCCNLEQAPFKLESFDLMIFSDVIEHVPDPRPVLRRAFELLRPGGTLVLLTPDFDALSEKLMRDKWLHYKQEHLVYLSRKAINTMLKMAGFTNVVCRSHSKPTHFNYAVSQFGHYPAPLLSGLVRIIERFIPDRLRTALFRIPMSEILVTAVRPLPVSGEMGL